MTSSEGLGKPTDVRSSPMASIKTREIFKIPKGLLKISMKKFNKRT